MTQPHRLKQIIWDHITQSYTVLGVFDFLDHDNSPASFYEWVKTWENYSFSLTERLVIIDTDTDYYPEGSFGNNLYNFFTCCREFNIPTEFIIFVSGTFNKSGEIKKLCDYFNLLPPMICEHLYLVRHTPNQDEVRFISFNKNKIKKLFFCLNGTLRGYRGLFLCHLAEENLLDIGYFGYHFSTSIKDKDKLKRSDLPNSQSNLLNVSLRSTLPFTRTNDFFKQSKKDIMIYHNHFNLFKNKNVTISDLKLDDNDDIWDLQPEFLQHGLINIVTETVFNYPYPYMSEKTMKPILVKRGFIHLSGPGMLALLKSFGFKTFDTVWDETYDSIVDPSERLNAVVSVMKEISNHDINDLSHKIQSIVEHNYQHYLKNNFRNTGLIRWINLD